MVKYDLSKTSADGADGGSGKDSISFTYISGEGVKVNVGKDTTKTAYTKYKHQNEKGTGGEKPSLDFKDKLINIKDFQPTEKLTSIDVYFLNYNKGPCAQIKGEMEEHGGKGVQGKCEKDKDGMVKGPGKQGEDEMGEGPGGMCAPVDKDKQETEQDKLPFLIVLNESENGSGSGPGSGETKKIYFGYPSESTGLSLSVDWVKWQEFKQGQYITDTGVRLQMKLKQIERALNKLGCIKEVRSTAFNIMNAEDGDLKVKFKSGIDNDYTVGYKQSIDDRFYENIFATWRDGGSNLGSNCLLEVDGSGESKCSEPIDVDGSMKSKIDQYYIDQVKAKEYKLIMAYFDTKGSKTSMSKSSQKDNLLLVEFVDEYGNTKYLRRRDMNGNWWSLREAKYVSGQKGLSAGNLLQRLNDISSGTQDKKVTAFILDKIHGEYKGVKEFKGDTNSNTAYNTYSHNLKGGDPGVRTVLLFGGEVIHINTLKPSRVRPNSVQVYYLKTKCGKDHDGGSDDKHPFLVVLERTGTGSRSIKRIYHLNDPKGSEGSKESNDWSKWEPFKNTKKYGVKQDVTTRLHEKLQQIEHECKTLGVDEKSRRSKVYEILTHVDREKGEEEVVDHNDDDGALREDDSSAAHDEEQEYEEDEQDYVKQVVVGGLSGDEKEKEVKVDEEKVEGCQNICPSVQDGVKVEEQANNSSDEAEGGGDKSDTVGKGSTRGLNAMGFQDADSRNDGGVILYQEMGTMEETDLAESNLLGPVPSDLVTVRSRGSENVASVQEPSGPPGTSVDTQSQGKNSVMERNSEEARSPSPVPGGPGSNSETLGPAGHQASEVSRGNSVQGDAGVQGVESFRAVGGYPASLHSLGTGGTSYSSSGEVRHSGSSRPKRSAQGIPGDGSGSDGQTPNESHTPVIIGSAAGTVSVAALSTGGYMWHRLGTRTIRDMMVYF